MFHRGVVGGGEAAKRRQRVAVSSREAAAAAAAKRRQGVGWGWGCKRGAWWRFLGWAGLAERQGDKTAAGGAGRVWLGWAGTKKGVLAGSYIRFSFLGAGGWELEALKPFAPLGAGGLGAGSPETFCPLGGWGAGGFGLCWGMLQNAGGRRRLANALGASGLAQGAEAFFWGGAGAGGGRAR